MVLAHPRINCHNVKDIDGRTPLMVAIRYNSTNCIKELLKVDRVDTGSENLSEQVRRLIDEEKNRRKKEKEKKAEEERKEEIAR